MLTPLQKSCLQTERNDPDCWTCGGASLRTWPPSSGCRRNFHQRGLMKLTTWEWGKESKRTLPSQTRTVVVPTENEMDWLPGFVFALALGLHLSLRCSSAPHVPKPSSLQAGCTQSKAWGSWMCFQILTANPNGAVRLLARGEGLNVLKSDTETTARSIIL